MQQWSHDKREIQDQLAQQGSHLSRHDRALEDQKLQITQLQTQVAQVLGDITNLGGSVPQKRVLSADFDRDTDKTIVCIRVAALAKIADVRADVDKHASDAGVESSCFAVEGSDADRNFTARFKWCREGCCR